MSVLTKIRLGFALPVLILALVSLASHWRSSEIAETSRWVDHTVVVLAKLKDLITGLNEFQDAQRRYMVLGSEQDNIAYDTATLQLHQRINEVRTLAADNQDQQNELKRLDAALAQDIALARQGSQVRQQHGQNAAVEWFNRGPGMSLGQLPQVRIRAMQDRESELLTQREHAAASASQATAALSFYGTLAALLLAVVVGAWTSGTITTAVRRLLAASQQIGSGVLSYRIPDAGRDEFGLLASAFNTMAGRIEHAQHELQRQTGILESVLSSMADGVAVADAQGKFLVFNPSAERILGMGASEGGPAEWTEHFGLFLPDTRTPYPPNQLPLALAMRGESVDGVEVFVRHNRIPEGAWLSVNARPLRSKDSAVQGGVAVFNDITERKKSEQEIIRLNEDLQKRAIELEALNKELEAFSYSVSHDLRAPLRHVDGYAELLMKSAGPLLDPKSRRYAQTISNSAKEMGQLIDDLLVFSRMGRTEMRATRLSLEQLARDVKQELDLDGQQREIVWRVGSLPVVQADPAMLRLVLVNLFSNALKYTRPRPQAEIEIGSCGSEPGQAVIFVRDNGVGFDMQYVDKLFGVFQRLHTADEFEGTGIGLANVRRIIHRHGGRTWAEGAVGQGATFYFSLPTHAEAA